VLTIAEYFIAVGLDSASTLVLLLSIVALIKAVVILEYFMHLSKLWRGEGSHS
jgi:heme/copper-type cytochrome/quinol oxidase subunit 4